MLQSFFVLEQHASSLTRGQKQYFSPFAFNSLPSLTISAALSAPKICLPASEPAKLIVLSMLCTHSSSPLTSASAVALFWSLRYASARAFSPG
ncbi:MAG: hypothetical protein IJP91_06750 [Synergistaceae bacterium]|nr:hypothetical protein [Synergistaceae bacterium]